MFLLEFQTVSVIKSVDAIKVSLFSLCHPIGSNPGLDHFYKFYVYVKYICNFYKFYIYIKLWKTVVILKFFLGNIISGNIWIPFFNFCKMLMSLRLLEKEELISMRPRPFRRRWSIVTFNLYFYYILFIFSNEKSGYCNNHILWSTVTTFLRAFLRKSIYR